MIDFDPTNNPILFWVENKHDGHMGLTTRKRKGK